jgi:hypothetical protein
MAANTIAVKGTDVAQGRGGYDHMVGPYRGGFCLATLVLHEARLLYYQNLPRMPNGASAQHVVYNYN